MPISNWLSNNKVNFSIVQNGEYEYLVCTSETGSHRVHFVEDLQTGKRAFGGNHPMIDGSKDMDAIVLHLIESL